MQIELVLRKLPSAYFNHIVHWIHSTDASSSSAVASGYEELLEVAEAILFSVPLPNGVLDKYKMIQQEVKGRMSVTQTMKRSARHRCSSQWCAQLWRCDGVLLLNFCDFFSVCLLPVQSVVMNRSLAIQTSRQVIQIVLSSMRNSPLRSVRMRRYRINCERLSNKYHS